MPSGSTWALPSVASEFTCQAGIPLWLDGLEFDPGSTAPSQVSFGGYLIFLPEPSFLHLHKRPPNTCVMGQWWDSVKKNWRQRAVILSNLAQVLILSSTGARNDPAQVRNKLTFIFQQGAKYLNLGLSSSLGELIWKWAPQAITNTDHVRVYRHSWPHHLNRDIYPWAKHYRRQGRWKAGMEGPQREALGLTPRVNLLVPWPG